MKQYRFLVIIILSAITLFSSCEKKWEDPAFTVPKYNGKKANKTIANIKSLHTLNSNQLDSIMPRGEFIVDAWVVSSDEGGNIYKTIYVQDETGGLEISVNKTGLFNDFPVGQKVFINCKGLVVGDYHNQFRMGWIYSGSVGQIHGAYVDNYFSKDGLPDLKSAPFEVTEIQSMADLTPENQSKLVIIRDCEFAEDVVGKPLSEDDVTTERTVTFNGASVVVRTSNYAKFRNIPCPEGKITLMGILTQYNDNYQLLLRTRHDIIEQGDVPGEELLLAMNFDENSLSTGGWSLSDESSTTAWRYVNSDNTMFHPPADGVLCNDWLISPAITLPGTEGVSLYLEHKMTIQGLPDFFQVYYSTSHVDGNFNESDWHAFDPNLSRFTAEFSLSNALDVSVIQNNNFRIAIRYNNSSAASRWYVKSIQFKK